MNNMNLIKATIKDSYREIHKKVKAYYRENPKSKVSVEKTVAICATELLGEDYWSFIKETGLGTLVHYAIIAGGPFPTKLYWVDALYEKYVSQGKPRVDKERVVKAIKSWEKEEWAYFTKQSIDAYFSEPQLYDKSTGDIYYAVKAWEWLHDSNKARQYFSDDFINDKERIKGIFFDGDRLRSSDEIEERIEEYEEEYGVDA